MWNVVNLLNPAAIINRLTTEITAEKLINSGEDPIQPIMDIVHGSIMKYDIATTRYGLKVVAEQFIGCLDSNTEKGISKHFWNHLDRVGRLTVSKEDEEAAVEILANVERFGRISAERGFKLVTAVSIEILGDLEIVATKKELEFMTLQIASSLGIVGEAAANNDYEDSASRAVQSLETCGIDSVEKRLKYASTQAERSIRNIGVAAAGNKLGNTTEQAARSLGFIGVAAAKNGLEFETAHAAKLLENIGRAAYTEGIKEGTKRAALALGHVGGAAAEALLKDMTREVAAYLAKLTALNEEIVNTAIRDNKSFLEETYPLEFSTFVNVYEEELDKIRTEKQK